MQRKCIIAIVCCLSAIFAGDIRGDETSVSWCETGGGCDEYISRVTVADLDNASTCVGYSDFTDFVAHMEIGHDYEIEIEISGAYSMDSGGVWIDWGQDYNFDEPDDEIQLDVDGGPGPIYHGIISVPDDAQTGETFLRVRLCFNQTPRPCGITTYGEVEDYLAMITGEPYLCGDASGDGAINVGDAVFLIDFIFRDGPAPEPLGAGDADCDGAVNIADAVYLIDYIFSGGPEPCCP